MPEPKIDPDLTYEDGRQQGWLDAIAALRDRATVSFTHFAAAATYLESGQLPLESALTEGAGLREALAASEAECASVIEERDRLRPLVELVRRARWRLSCHPSRSTTPPSTSSKPR